MTRDVLTEAEWRRVHEQTVQAELSPDPAQTSWLPPEQPKPKPKRQRKADD